VNHHFGAFRYLPSPSSTICFCMEVIPTTRASLSSVVPS
jgi:hypothetical protein